jgi:O-antigen/teichoic acid export membrane protein
VVVPWLFGPAWEPAVVPTQILAGAGAATVVIDAVGSTLMAAGRTRALLGYGVAHFIVYAGAVLFASSYGVEAVCVAAVSVHLVFLWVAYGVLVRGYDASGPFRLLWEDVSAAGVSCLAMAAVLAPVTVALDRAATPALAHIAVVAVSGGVVYLVALRAWFPAEWRDLTALIARILPARPARAIVRRIPLPAEPEV